MATFDKESLLRGWEATAPHGCLDIPLCMRELERCELFTELATERLNEKAATLKKIFEASENRWEQTLYEMLFRTVGDLRNREHYHELARRIPYHTLQRERSQVLHIEALLFGGSGLLEGCREDNYTAALKESFDYLSQKYNIRPMEPQVWHIDRIRPANHPRLRLSQLATLLGQHELLIEELLACRDCASVERLFTADSSQYWSSYYKPSESSHSTKRLGSIKAQLIGINLVAPMQYFYGSFSGRDELQARALELWEGLPAEENRYTRIWEPFRPMNAFESQALLQLAREYCEQHRCRQCPLARRRLRALATEADK